MSRLARLPGLLFVVLAAAVATFRVTTWDVWWHLAAGRWIVAHRRVPRTDPFSYTAEGHEWIDHEWLFQLFVYGVERLAGAPGLVVAKALLVAAAAAVVYRFVRRETGLPPALVALGLVPFLVAGRYRYVVRPELFTVLFAALLVAALLRRRERPPRWWELAWIPAMFAVWANVHGGVIAGVVLLGAFAAGRGIETLIPPFGKGGPGGIFPAATAIALTVAAVLAGLLNPFGWRVYEVPFRLTALIADGPFQNLEWAPPRWPAHAPFYVVATVTAVLAVVALARHRHRVAWSALLPLAFLLFVSLRYVRNVALFALVTPILLVALLAPDLQRAAARRATLGPLLASALLAALAVAFVVTGAGYAPGLGIDTRRIPVAAADFVAANFVATNRPPGHMLNAYAFGGFAAWRLYPEHRIFLDGRNEVFADLRQRLVTATRDSREWRRLLADHDVGWTFLQYVDRTFEVREMDPAGGPPRLVHQPFAVTYFPPDEWALVYWDDTAMVHVRRTPESAALIARHESAVQPESGDYLRELLATGRADPTAVRWELIQRTASGPGPDRARRLLAALSAPE